MTAAVIVNCDAYGASKMVCLFVSRVRACLKQRRQTLEVRLTEMKMEMEAEVEMEVA